MKHIGCNKGKQGKKTPITKKHTSKKPDRKWLPLDPQSAEEQPLPEARNQKDESATFNNSIQKKNWKKRKQHERKLQLDNIDHIIS